MKTSVARTFIAILAMSSLSGCIGQMAASGAVLKMNLSVVDNRYARAGLYTLMSPVYGLAATADLFVFNTIEFWTGKNPISGKGPAVADMPASALIKINSKLNKELTSAPIKISHAEIKQHDENTLEIEVSFKEGNKQFLRGEKKGDKVDFYANGTFITSASIDELAEYAAKRI